MTVNWVLIAVTSIQLAGLRRVVGGPEVIYAINLTTVVTAPPPPWHRIILNEPAP